MSIWDIINPWGALRRERRRFVQAVADYEAERAVSASSLRQQRIENEALLDEIQQLGAELEKLRARIAKGHFRNPETGRIGRAGQVYE